MKKWKPLLPLFCLLWFIVGLFLLSQVGYKYIGKSYFESADFEYNLEQFESDLGPYVLNVPKAEELKEKLTVSQQEIEEHRNRYGSLTDQIANIRAQYEGQIQEAIASNAENLKAKLETERDAKIQDITKNFEDDEYVKLKVLKEKEAVIDEYIAAVRKEAPNFKKNYNYFSYELLNTESGKKYISGDVSEDLAFKVTYTAQKPLRTWNISDNLNGILHQAYVNINTDREVTDGNEYVNEDGGMFTDSVATELTSSSSEETTTIAQEYTYTGTIVITKNAYLSMGDKDDYDKFKRNQIVYSIIWISSLIAAFYAWRLRKCIVNISVWRDLEEKLSTIRFDWHVMSVFVMGIVYLLSFILFYESIEYQYHNNYVEFIIQLLLSTVVLNVIGIAFIVQVIWLYRRVNTFEKLGRNLRESILWQWGNSIKDLFLNRSMAVQSIIIVASAVFGGGSFVAAVVDGSGIFVLAFGISAIVGVPALVVFLSRMGYLNRIMKDTADLAEGRLNRDIKVKGKSPLAKHAENLNHLREGVRTSMHEQAKSERLKTELITNVSHDLRTPLTSIITYTDLLKKPDITDEERKQYIEILDKKSERLKVLIEDLFEVSKMASGNIELHKSRVDLTQLVQQAIGEHEEELVKARLDLRMTVPKEPIYAYVDGQKWWRLIDNLTVNVLKYALEGTRVYVTLKYTTNGNAEFTVKNVAKYEISEDADELFERFKRADSSRHTEGSGLGLAIAQSIVDLHGARMRIEVDGDLFKVIVTIPTV